VRGNEMNPVLETALTLIALFVLFGITASIDEAIRRNNKKSSSSDPSGGDPRGRAD
jgi:hypothetical protein